MMHANPLTSQPLADFLTAALASSDRRTRMDGEAQLAKLAGLQRHYADQMEALWRSATASASGEPTPASPPEASGPGAADRKTEAYFDLLRQTYQIGSSFLNELVDCADVGERNREQLRFLVRQFAQSLSPSNYLATNPEALALARETKGESLAAGVRNLLTDLARGQMTLTDPAAFEVGRNLATTPGAVVFENELIQLVQYAPTTDTVDEHPILIVPPCINRFYILDLQPESSFVRYALSQGRTVFMLSWRSATREIAHLTWDDYLRLGVLTALHVTQQVAGTSQVHGVGFCVGGTLLACATAVLRGRGEEAFATLTLLTTILDFADTGEIGLLVDAPLVAAREVTIGGGGLLYGSELASVFSLLRANDLVWPYVVDNYLKGLPPKAFDILHWNADSTNLPGPMYCWYLRKTYLENALRVPGATVQCGVPVDLSRIDMPIYVLATRDDHIVPWKTAFATLGLVGGEARFVLGASGHIAGVINPPSRNKRSYWVDGEQGIGPLTWLRTAREVKGSWWTDWAAWLDRYSGRRMGSPAGLGSEAFPPLEAAPGRYVTTKAERPLIDR
jgi:polyhydroxyalkanoate synthase